MRASPPARNRRLLRTTREHTVPATGDTRLPLLKRVRLGPNGGLLPFVPSVRFVGVGRDDRI